MRPRKSIGGKNEIGQTVVKLRKERKMKQKELLAQLQTRGVDMSLSTLSDLEGQNRAATDREIRILAEVFNVPIEALYPKEKSLSEMSIDEQKTDSYPDHYTYYL